MTYTQIEVSNSIHSTRITINRPAQRNALTATVINELTHAFKELSNKKQLRSVVLTGAGREAFCAGADLEELKKQAAPDLRRIFFTSIAELISAIQNCPVPVISSIHGFALAGGLGLVAASDIAISADDGVFGLPEVAIGLAPLVVMSPLSSLLTPRALSQLALTAERISAQQALEAGLISQIVPKALLESTVDKMCHTLSQRAPSAIKATKRAIADAQRNTRDDFIFELADRSALLSIGEEATEGVAAFTEKRDPSWRIK